MNTLLRRLLAPTCAVAVLALTACGGSDAATTTGGAGQGDGNAEITLRVADSFPLDHVMSVAGAQYWMAEIEKASDGRIAFEHFPAGQLVGADALLDATRDGLTDVGYIAPTYVSDLMPLSAVASVPGTYENALQGSQAFWELINTDLLEPEYLANGVRPVFAVAAPTYQVMISSPIDSVQDFEGKKLRSPGGISDDIISAAGAVPVSMPAADTYTGVERGTLDGALLGLASISGYNLQEVLKATTVNAPMGGLGVTYVINEDVWQSIPGDLQAVISDVNEATVTHVAQAWADEEDTELQALRENGDLDLYELSDAEISALQAKLEPVGKAWAAGYEAEGKPAEAILARWQELNAQYADNS